MGSFFLYFLYLISFLSLQANGFQRIFNVNKANETQITVELPQHGARQRRSGDFPEELIIELMVDLQPVRLLIHRNDHISHHVPSTVERNGHILHHVLNEEQNVGYYYDTWNGSSFMVQYSNSKDAGNEYEFFGTFNLHNKTYLVQPPDAEHKTHAVTQVSTVKHSPDDVVHLPTKGLEGEIGLKTSASPNNRQKRQTTAYEVEILMVVDFSVYTFWKDRVSGSSRIDIDTQAKQNLRQYYALMLNAMDLRYKSVTGRGFEIKLLFAGIHIADTSSAASWTETAKNANVFPVQVNSKTALDNFKDWENHHIRSLPGHDHAMLFTKYDLEANKSTDNLGKAFVGGLCDEYRVSVIEDTFEATTATTAAHELGHSLNAEHDGDGNSCSVTGGYVMDAKTGASNDSRINKRLWVFSSCSIDYFDAFIKELNRQHSNCMAVQSPRYNSSALYEFASDLMGQIYPPDYQCEAINGKGSYMCRASLDFNYSRICADMDCATLENNGTCLVQIPWGGTTCGNGKICYEGSCVPSALAPTGLSEKCVFGDQPGNVARRGKTCHELITVDAQHYECYNFQEACCDTCEAVKKLYVNGTQPDCLYGDKAPECTNLTARHCYLPGNSDICCRHCQQFDTGIQECRYGDKSSWCATLKPHECYANHNVCCSRCKQFETGIPDCLYGDKAVGCATLPEWQCYSNNETCCSHCQKLDTGIPECRYGDQASWCSTLKPHECYNNDDVCCSLCKQLKKGITGHGCEYGDRNPNCDATRCGEYDDHSRNVLCCSTCSPQPQAVGK